HHRRPRTDRRTHRGGARRPAAVGLTHRRPVPEGPDAAPRPPVPWSGARPGEGGRRTRLPRRCTPPPYGAPASHPCRTITVAPPHPLPRDPARCRPVRRHPVPRHRVPLHPVPGHLVAGLSGSGWTVGCQATRTAPVTSVD